AVTHDLARAAAVREDLPGLAAARRGIAVLAASARAALVGWGARGLLGLALIATAAFISHRLGVVRPSAIAAIALVHQGVAFALLWLRASWLSLAMRLAEARAQPMSDR